MVPHIALKFEQRSTVILHRTKAFCILVLSFQVPITAFHCTPLSKFVLHRPNIPQPSRLHNPYKLYLYIYIMKDYDTDDDIEDDYDDIYLFQQ